MGFLVFFYFPWILAFLILYWAMRQNRRQPDFAASVECWLASRLHQPTQTAMDRLYLPLGLLAVLAVFVWLERFEPFFFSKDDNLSSFFPVILNGCRSAFSGVFPSWNPYQYLGSPTTTYGVYSLTYPVLYLAYGIARLIGQEFATLEVLAFLHLVAAYFANVAWLRGLRWSKAMVAAGAFAVTYSGYQIVAGRSWYYMMPVAVYFPLLLRQLHALLENEKIGNRWVWRTGLILGLWFHAGNAQMWTYGILFSGAALALWWYSKELAPDRLTYAAAALTVGVGIATPLLLLQARELAARSFVETGTFSYNIPELFMLPFLRDFLAWRVEGLPYAGGTAYFLLVALMLSVHLASRRRFSRHLIGGQVYTILAFFAAVLAAGSRLGLWKLFIALPPFAKFAVPFKFLGIFIPLCVASAGFFIERISRNRGVESWFPPCAAAIIVGLTLWNLAANNQPFFFFADKPYPSASTAFAKLVHPGTSPEGRIYAHAKERSPRPGFVLNLSLNFPTVYQVPAFSGYDTTSESNPAYQAAADRVDLHIEELKEYGVRWILSDRRPFSTLDRKIETTKRLFANLGALPMTKRLDLGDIDVFEVPGARPLVFDADSGRPVPFTLRADGLDITSTSAHTITANFLNRPWMEAHDQNGLARPIQSDAYGRMTLTLTPAANTLAIRYAPPWMATILAGVIVLLFGLAIPSIVNRFTGFRSGGGIK